MRTIFLLLNIINNNIILISGDYAQSPFSSRKTHRKRSLVQRISENKLECIGFDIFLHPNQLCNGELDCPDGSDEFSCVEINWTNDHLPSGCRSSPNCSNKNKRYQYSATLDECVDCSIPGSRCVPCQVKPMFETLDSCYKFCKIPNQSRKLNKRKISINFLYQQKYPQLFAATGITEQNWLNGKLQPIAIKEPTSKNKPRNFALRGILLMITKERSGRYEVRMTNSEQIGPTQWLRESDFTVALSVKMKRNKVMSPGREIILTGHTTGDLDNEGRLLIDNGIFRKSKSRTIRRELRRKFG